MGPCNIVLVTSENPVQYGRYISELLMFENMMQVHKEINEVYMNIIANTCQYNFAAIHVYVIHYEDTVEWFLASFKILFGRANIE